MSKPALYRIEFNYLPTYEERLSLEAALYNCGGRIQDFIYFYKRNMIRYRLTSEEYESFIGKFKLTEHWKRCNVIFT